jgi:predicted transcriptional regulator
MAAAVCCSAGIHRVYVVDPDQRPAGVVTTTDVLQLLSCACSKE